MNLIWFKINFKKWFVKSNHFKVQLKQGFFAALLEKEKGRHTYNKFCEVVWHGEKLPASFNIYLKQRIIS